MIESIKTVYLICVATLAVKCLVDPYRTDIKKSQKLKETFEKNLKKEFELKKKE